MRPPRPPASWIVRRRPKSKPSSDLAAHFTRTNSNNAGTSYFACKYCTPRSDQERLNDDQWDAMSDGEREVHAAQSNWLVGERAVMWGHLATTCLHVDDSVRDMAMEALGVEEDELLPGPPFGDDKDRRQRGIQWLMQWGWQGMSMLSGAQDESLSDTVSEDMEDEVTEEKRRQQWRARQVARRPRLRTYFAMATALTLLALLLFCWTFVTFDSYLVRWGQGKVSPVPADQSMTQGCNPVSPEKKPFVVVVPLISSQAARLNKSISRWPRFPPCKSADVKTKPDLVFYLDLPWDHDGNTQSAKTQIDDILNRAEINAEVERCFGDVVFYSAEMTPAMSANSNMEIVWMNLRQSKGSNEQFYRMLKDDRFRKAYNYAFLAEPDTWAIRPHWLDAMRHLIAPEVDAESGLSKRWVIGSTLRYSHFRAGFEPWRSIFRFHLNGNAFYRLGDSCFESFVEQSRRVYGDGAYDVAMAYLRYSLRNNELFLNTAHRFAVTDFISNLGSEVTTEESLRERMSTTYLVHGKKMLEAVSR